MTIFYYGDHYWIIPEIRAGIPKPIPQILISWLQRYVRYVKVNK